MSHDVVRTDYYRQLFENAFEPILILDGQHFVDGNAAALNILGMSQIEELKATHPGQLSPQHQPDGKLSHTKANEMIQSCYEQGYMQFEWLHQRLDGATFLVEVTLKTILIDGKTLLHTTWRPLDKERSLLNALHKQNQLLIEKNKLINDVKHVLHTSNDRQLFDHLNTLEQYRSILDESAIVSKADRAGNITYVNDKFCEVSGFSREELIGENHRIVRHPDMSADFFKTMWQTIRSKKTFKAIIKNQTKDKKAYYVDSTIMPILDSDDNIIEYISVRHDITKLYEQDALIHEQYTDNLTKLANRIKLMRDISLSIAPKIALLNIDNFKDINESYQLEVGDAILVKVAERLSALESTNIKAYRLSGDIFALLACGNVTLDQLQRISQNFAHHLNKNSVTVEDLKFNLSVTVGLAAGQYKLLSHAEIAHLYAKKNNKESAVFDEELPIYKEMIENIQITKEIRNAINHNNILLFGQKIINNQSQEEKYEALMRIRSDDGRIISPFFFLEQAKKAKLYPELSRSIIKQACHYFKDKPHSFSINLMIEDIKNEKTIACLFDTLKQTNTAKRVILEIVESEAIETFKEVEDFIQAAKALGCKVAIDDFGTGYSNFEYITRLNIDILKIDGSLIKNIHIDKNTHLAVKTIVNFAQVLNLEVVAEFVHCEEVQQIVKDLGVTYSQGYLFHQPEQLV